MAYKVVDKESRLGSNAALCMFINKLSIDEFKAQIILFKVEEYFPEYKQGATVNAVPNSAEICCFRTMQNAEEWVAKNRIAMKPKFAIIKVRGKKKIRDPILVCSCGAQALSINELIKGNTTLPPPKGFISFEKVKVLE